MALVENEISLTCAELDSSCWHTEQQASGIKEFHFNDTLDCSLVTYRDNSDDAQVRG